MFGMQNYQCFFSLIVKVGHYNGSYLFVLAGFSTELLLVDWRCLWEAQVLVSFEFYFLIYLLHFNFSLLVVNHHKQSNLPNILNACSAFTAFGAISLNTDIISRKSSKVQSPSLLELKTLQILSLKGLTRSSGYCRILAIGSLAFLLWPTFSGASALNFECALQINME